MEFKVFFLCASAFFAQSISAQCFGRSAVSQPCSTPSFVRTFVGRDGCSLTVTCGCPISPNGVSVLSDLGIRGDVSVSGSLPFQSVVAIDGNLESSGTATVSYGCGDGNIVITKELGNSNGQAGTVSLNNFAGFRL